MSDKKTCGTCARSSKMGGQKMGTEKRLIYADAAAEAVCYNCMDKYDCQDRCSDYMEVFNVPTVDAVEVVRCKDCKHWLPYPSLGVNDCGLHKGLVLTKENSYCSYGERKDND